ncbi:hypothetical protein F7644_02275 [Tenacibaculum finnmarkense genomovar ulcerans]|uniref:hypothetical protein n=1 Tax=Tenacibaculum finnmarkense TaxID=2781243 RepID=UPI00187B3F60|nr:hypothetical protein [Tenacibaculum finnmarkense]MBE7644809.1 hypothetical protein [Tenacibaculum finnmarkense genomovar ulcerans]
MKEIEFIEELLKSKNLTDNHKARIVKLAMGSFGGNDLLERIEKLEDKISEDINLKNLNPIIEKSDNHKIEKEVEQPIISSEGKPIKYFDPKHLYTFLLAYNQDEVLKSTCHLIDSSDIDTINNYCGTDVYVFEKHLEKILEAYQKIEKKYAPSFIKASMSAYLRGKNYNGKEVKGWSSDVIKINWSCSELSKWVKDNKGFPPCPDPGYEEEHRYEAFEFKEDIEIRNSPYLIPNFSELIIHFKNLFHIRQDNSMFNILSNINENYHDKICFSINPVNFPTNIELFTDVDKLKQAYKKILYLVLECHNGETKPNVALSFEEIDKKTVILSILHLNSTFKKSITNAIERVGKSYTDLIKKQINGLCNFYVQAPFGNNSYAEINFWNGKSRRDKKIEKIEGVIHILEFKKG